MVNEGKIFVQEFPRMMSEVNWFQEEIFFTVKSFEFKVLTDFFFKFFYWLPFKTWTLDAQ